MSRKGHTAACPLGGVSGHGQLRRYTVNGVVDIFDVQLIGIGLIGLNIGIAFNIKEISRLHRQSIDAVFANGRLDQIAIGIIFGHSQIAAGDGNEFFFIHLTAECKPVSIAGVGHKA